MQNNSVLHHISNHMRVLEAPDVQIHIWKSVQNVSWSTRNNKLHLFAPSLPKNNRMGSWTLPTINKNPSLDTGSLEMEPHNTRVVAPGMANKMFWSATGQFWAPKVTWKLPSRRRTHIWKTLATHPKASTSGSQASQRNQHNITTTLQPSSLQLELAAGGTLESIKDNQFMAIIAGSWLVRDN